MSDNLFESAFQRQWFGKFRATVTDNNDPEALGRLKCRVPALGDVELGWALPCVPYAGSKVGFYMVPDPQANVWVEFEGGDPSRPVWVGAFWTADQKLDNAVPDVKVLKTNAHTISLDDTSGSEKIEIKHRSGTVITIDTNTLTITHSGGASLTMDSSSIAIDNNGPKATLDSSGVSLENGGQKVAVGTSSVTINGTSLEVL
ncbi:MAG TPA: phage baseplate assembly protein V [Spirochaetia bacterium]|nr:phage baseplate assembly protein V [Spirochaetia bacterium]